MKVAISIPDDVFRRVERAAKRLGVSRSELLSRAAREFLDMERARDITASYDRAFGPDDPGAEADPTEARFRHETARRALRDVEW